MRARAAPGFLPWPLPAALFLALGIVLARLELPFWAVILLCAAVVLALAALRERFGAALLLSVLLLPLGYLRYDAWQHQANPLQPLLEQEREFSGVSDGDRLRLDEPAGVRVALAPRGRVPAGRVTLRGTLVAPSGKRNPGGFDYAAYLRGRGVWAQLLVDEVIAHQPARFDLKERLRRGVVAGLGERQAALVQAMTLGVRDDLGELRELFAASGLAHLLALSGLHVGILVAALALLLAPLGVRRYPFLMLLVVGFAALVGPTPSIVRASAMTVAVLGSLWWGGGRLEPWPALALSALVSLLWSPAWLFDISFQLSYLAVVGLLIFVAPLTRALLRRDKAAAPPRPWWHWQTLVVGVVVASLSAQLLTLPLVASSFGSLPLLSPLVNVAGIPLATALVPLGLLAGLLGLAALPLAALLNALTGVLAGLLIGLADWGSSLPNLIWGEVAPVGYALYYLAMLALALWAFGWLRPWRALVVVLAAALASLAARPPHPPPELIAFDVGQGDSVLIRLPGRQEVLIDGGGTPFGDFDVGKQTVWPALKALGVDELELVIATHPDTDHLEGLVSLLELMPVNRLVIGVPNPESEVFTALMNAAERRHVPVTAVRRGEVLALGEASLEVLNPPSRPYPSENENSVAVVLRYRGVAKAILLGDLPISAEAGMAFPKVDIVMAAHHGSRTSTSAHLLAAAQPREVILSYGRNNYGHPSPEVLERIAASGARLHETFKEGAVRLPLE